VGGACLQTLAFQHTHAGVPHQEGKATDDVAGPARAPGSRDAGGGSRDAGGGGRDAGGGSREAGGANGGADGSRGAETGADGGSTTGRDPLDDTMRSETDARGRPVGPRDVTLDDHDAPGDDHGAPGHDHDAPGHHHGAPGHDHDAPGHVHGDEEVDPEAPTAEHATLPESEPDTLVDAPLAVAELAAACVRFVATRYGVHLDFTPETLSLVDHWIRDARAELATKSREGAAAGSLPELVQSAAGAYLGEVVRRAFGGVWSTSGEHADWRLYLTRVYCAFNPLGMAREALLEGEAEGWHAHFELDPGDRDEIDARLAALPEVSEDEYYAPSTRFDVVHLVVDSLREKLRASGLGDTRFDPSDYGDG